MNIPVTAVQRFCHRDGPGIRTVVFLKGCPLRCAWCHNPEAQTSAQQIYYRENKCVNCRECAFCPAGAQIFGDGLHVFDRSKCTRCGKCADRCPAGALENALTVFSTEELLRRVLADRDFYGETGGVTLSGGEPMAHPEEALGLLSACKKAGLNTAVETCGYFDVNYLSDLKKYADLLLWDVKLTNEEAHRRYTGVPFSPIRENLFLADGTGIPTLLRCILVAGVNDDETHFKNVAALFAALKHCAGAEIIPYHEYGASKAKALNMPYTADAAWIPSPESIRRFQTLLAAEGVPVLA